MKTFDDEYNKLKIWFKESHEKADKVIAELPKVGGFDDRSLPIKNAVWHEWNIKLMRLKVKYGKELSEEEIELGKKNGIL